MVAKERIKNANLIPAHQKLWSCVSTKTTDIDAGKRHAGEPDIEQHGQTLLQMFKPGCIITQPDRGVSLNAGAGRTGQNEGPLTRPVFGQRIAGGQTHQKAVQIAHFKMTNRLLIALLQAPIAGRPPASLLRDWARASDC